MNILQIDSSILGAHSASRTITGAVVRKLQSTPGAKLTYRDLAAEDIGHATAATLPSAHPLSQTAGPLEGEAAAARAKSDAMLEEFLAADVVVIGAPMYNFTIPSQLKAWLDRIVVPGKTFSYGEQGPQGLAGGKRVIIVATRGGFYGTGSPGAAASGSRSRMACACSCHHGPDDHQPWCAPAVCRTDGRDDVRHKRVLFASYGHSGDHRHLLHQPA